MTTQSTEKKHFNTTLTTGLKVRKQVRTQRRYPSARITWTHETFKLNRHDNLKL
jgi:hypothetical protein